MCLINGTMVLHPTRNALGAQRLYLFKAWGCCHSPTCDSIFYAVFKSRASVQTLSSTKSALTLGFIFRFMKLNHVRLTSIFFQNGFLSALPYFTMWMATFPFSVIADYLVKKKIFSFGASRKFWNSVCEYYYPIQ